MSDSLDKQCEASVHRAVGFLAQRQRASGEFATYRSDSAGMSEPRIYDPSPFATVFVLEALSRLEDSEAQGIIRQGLDYLIAEREPPGVWRYWSSENPMTIEPDTDVTCCAGALVRRLAPDRHVIDADTLLLQNRTLRGLFKTWLRDGASPNDVSLGVNANALYYFGPRDDLKPVVRHLNRACASGRTEDWYYPNPAAVSYFVSRAYASGVGELGDSRDALVEGASMHCTDNSDVLTVALALCSLFSFEAAAKDSASVALDRIVSSQHGDGGWPSVAFYAGPEPPGPHAYWWGSEELTTAFCIEALACWQARQR